jgi:hypothetical protein
VESKQKAWFINSLTKKKERKQVETAFTFRVILESEWGEERIN